MLQVIFEENKQTVEGISEIVKAKNSILEKKSIKPLIDHSEVLLDFVTIILKVDQEEKDMKSIKENFTDCTKGL